MNKPNFNTAIRNGMETISFNTETFGKVSFEIGYFPLPIDAYCNKAQHMLYSSSGDTKIMFYMIRLYRVEYEGRNLDPIEVKDAFFENCKKVGMNNHGAGQTFFRIWHNEVERQMDQVLKWLYPREECCCVHDCCGRYYPGEIERTNSFELGQYLYHRISFKNC